MDKHYHISKFQIAEIGEDSGIFSGHSAVFDELVPSYNEIVDRGAFTQTLRHNKGQVPVLWLHGGGMFGAEPVPIGMGQKAEEDSYGFWTEGKLDLQNNQLARETWGFMKLAKEVDRRVGQSIGFTIVNEIRTENEPTHLTEIRLWEYSITPPDWQAAPNAGVSEMHSQYKTALYRVVADIMTNEMGIKTPALEALTSTQDATPTNEAQLHSVAESLDVLLSKLRRT